MLRERGAVRPHQDGTQASEELVKNGFADVIVFPPTHYARTRCSVVQGKAKILLEEPDGRRRRPM